MVPFVTQKLKFKAQCSQGSRNIGQYLGYEINRFTTLAPDKYSRKWKEENIAKEGKCNWDQMT